MSAWEQRASDVLQTLRLESIRGKFLAFAAVATLVPSLGTAWFSYVQNRRSLTEKIAQGLEGASGQGAREVGLWLKEQLYDLRVFASSYEVSENLERLARGAPGGRGGPRARLAEYLRSVRERFATYEELSVLDHAGRVVTRSARGGAAPQFPVAWLKDLRAGQPVLGDAFLDQATGRAAVLVAVPIHGANARFVGGLAAKLDLAAVDTLLAPLVPTPAGRLFVVTQAGTLITGSRAADAVPLRTRLPDGTARALLERESAAVTYTAFGGDNAVGVLQRVPLVAWGVVAEVPADAAYRQVTRLRNLILLALAALLAGLGSLAYFLGLLIIRPIDRLRQGAAKVAAGDLGVDLPIMSGGEVGYLTAVFNDMVDRLREGRSELERLSITDGLTGLSNRRHLNKTLDEETRRSKRHRHHFAVLMADLDHFKQYNDTHGHLAGDEVLTAVAKVLRESTRDLDHAARYGGEEFLVMMPETRLEGGLEVAERIRARVAAERKAGKAVTVSVGVAEFPTHGDSPEALIASADAAMYAAKHQGRNRVVAAGTAPVPDAD